MATQSLFAFCSPYTEEFDPLFIYAFTLEEAREKIKKLNPGGIYSVYKFVLASKAEVDALTDFRGTNEKIFQLQYVGEAR